jgi:ribosomal protein S18 acetylase RimI-like enzyme
VVIRPALPPDGNAVAELVVETPGGLVEIVGDSAAALRMARAAFRSPRSAFSHRRCLVAEEGGMVVGQIVRLPGSEWRRLRVGTGLVMLRAAGVGSGVRLLWRGPVEERLMPPVRRDTLYVASLSVRPENRGKGIGGQLLRRAIDEAPGLGLRAVALDVAARNEGAIRFYRRHGFGLVEERRTPPRRGLPAGGSIRMERSLGA